MFDQKNSVTDGAAGHRNCDSQFDSARRKNSREREGEAKSGMTSIGSLPPHTNAQQGETGQITDETQSSFAGLKIQEGGGHDGVDTQWIRASADLILELIHNGRLRRRWHKAEKSLTLQAKAMLRSFTDGDKDAANKLYATYAKKYAGLAGDDSFQQAEVLTKFFEADEYADALLPFLYSGEVFASHRAGIEKDIRKTTKALPIWKDWAEGVRGLGDLRLGIILSETGDLSNYATVSKLWKRCGLAVIDGERQRRVSGDDALAHGYNPERRSVLYCLATEVLKAQIRVVKDEDGKKTDERIALGEYGQFYLDEKVRQREKVETDGHAHNRAARHMTKRILKDLWKAWRRGGHPHSDTHHWSASPQITGAE